MNRLLTANLQRLVRDKIFWACCAAMMLIGVLYTLNTEPNKRIDNELMRFCLFIALAIPLFISLFIGTELDENTIRNKIIVGRSRSSIYFANLIIGIAASITMCIAYLLPVFAIGIPLHGNFQMGTGTILSLLGIALAMMAAFVSLFTLVSMLGKNRALIVVSCVVLFFTMQALSFSVMMRLNEPEYYSDYTVYDESGNPIYSEEIQPNPAYPDEGERAILQFTADFLPSGQSLMLFDGATVNPRRMPVYSLSVIVITTSAGLILFKRKDLR